MFVDCTAPYSLEEIYPTSTESKQKQYQELLAKVAGAPYYFITFDEEKMLQSMCEECPLSEKDVDNFEVVWPRLSNRAKEAIYPLFPFDFQISFFQMLSEDFKTLMLPILHDRLVGFEKEKRMAILHEADDPIVRYFYSNVSFLDDINLRHVVFGKVEEQLSSIQKDLLLRLISLNHPETVQEVQGSDLLRYLACRELEKYLEQFSEPSAEHTIYHTLKALDSLQEHLLPKDFLRVLLFVRMEKGLLSAAIIGQRSEVALEIQKVKKIQSGLPFTIEYNRKTNDVMVRLANLDEGMYKKVKKCLFLSTHGVFMMAVSKQVIRTQKEIFQARNELAMWMDINGFPNTLPLREYKVYISQKARCTVVRTVSPLCSMGKLTNWLSPGQLSRRELLVISLDLLRAVKKLHSNCILHRDIKPDNILLHETFINGKRVVRAILADFGWSCRYHHDSRKMMVGSPMYMHPFVLQNCKTSDYCSDVWSIGATMHYMFTGTPFFDDQGVMEDLIEKGVSLGDSTKNRAPSDKNSIDFVIWKMLQPYDIRQFTLDEVIARVERLVP